MRHAYFQHDQFVERYEIELRRIIDLEKEKEQNDRTRRKRSKKVLGKRNFLNFQDHSRAVASRKENYDDKRSSVTE